MPTSTAATTHPPAAAGRKQTGLFRCISLCFVALIVHLGVTVLVIWLLIKPKRLVYTIEDGSIHNFNLTNNNRLNSTFDFVIKAHNPNARASVYYDSINVSVACDNQDIAFTTLQPFHQPRRTETRLEARIVAENAALSGSVSKHLKLIEKKSGEVELEVHVKAKIRFRVGIWKSRRRTLRISCSPVTVHFSSSKSFSRTSCDVEL